MSPIGEQAFALRLRDPGPEDPGALAGEVEHVRSGERRRFGDGAELLASLRELRALAAAGTGAGAKTSR